MRASGDLPAAVAAEVPNMIETLFTNTFSALIMRLLSRMT